MARPDLWTAAIQLVHRPPGDLSRDFRRRFFSIDLSHTAIGRGRLSGQCRVVWAHDFSFWAWGFFAGAAHCPLSDVWRHALRRALLHGAGARRTEIRHRSRPPARPVSGLRSTARAGIFSLFHLAAL